VLSQSLVLFEFLHGWVVSHVMVAVEVVLELPITVEEPLGAFDSAHETLDDILDHSGLHRNWRSSIDLVFELFARFTVQKTCSSRDKQMNRIRDGRSALREK